MICVTIAHDEVLSRFEHILILLVRFANAYKTLSTRGKDAIHMVGDQDIC